MKVKEEKKKSSNMKTTNDFSSVKITITNEELLNLSIKLEEEERIKFEVYNCLRKGENETPSEFKARRNERIRQEYNLGGMSVEAIAEKYKLSIPTVERVIKGIKKVKKLAYIDKRYGRFNHTQQFRTFLSEKIERHLEIYKMNKVNFKPLSIKEVEFETVEYKHPKADLLPDGCYMVDTETGELIEVEKQEDVFSYGKPKSEKVVKEAEKALSRKPNAKLMAELDKFCAKLRSSKKEIEL